MKLVLFDFDGTLTTKDTLNEFLKFSVGYKKYFLNLFLFMPTFVLYKLKIISNNSAKEKLISLFFKNWDAKIFQEKAYHFSLHKIDTMLHTSTYKKLLAYKQSNARIIIISASIECWLEPWCNKHGIELLSTKLEITEKKVSGKFLTKNCYGIEKVNRLKEIVTLSNFSEIIAYGDSAGDDEMFKIATTFYKIKH